MDKGQVKLPTDLKCDTRDYSRHRVATSLNFLTTFTQVAVPNSTVMSLLFLSLLCWAPMGRKGVRQVRGAADGKQQVAAAMDSHCTLLCSGH